MAQKDAAGHVEEKHTLQHDRPQRSDGRSRNDDEKHQAVTGDLLPEKEGQAPSLFRDILQEEGTAVINTFQGGEATFGCTRGTLALTTLLLPRKCSRRQRGRRTRSTISS